MLGDVEFGKVGNADFLDHAYSLAVAASFTAFAISAACDDLSPPPDIGISTADGGVHRAIASACAADRFRAHPSRWIAGESAQGGEAGNLQQPAEPTGASAGHHRIGGGFHATGRRR